MKNHLTYSKTLRTPLMHEPNQWHEYNERKRRREEAEGLELGNFAGLCLVIAFLVVLYCLNF
jgi:hypothetical protein